MVHSSDTRLALYRAICHILLEVPARRAPAGFYSSFYLHHPILKHFPSKAMYPSFAFAYVMIAVSTSLAASSLEEKQNQILSLSLSRSTAPPSFQLGSGAVEAHRLKQLHPRFLSQNAPSAETDAPKLMAPKEIAYHVGPCVADSNHEHPRDDDASRQATQ